MVAANAQIGVAKASFFPNLSLTGLGGLESNALHQFITAPSETWYAAFNVSQPVFQAERSALNSGSPVRTGKKPCSLTSKQFRTPWNRFQFTRRFSKRPRVPRTTRIAHTSSAADRSTLRGSLQERRRELPASADQRNELLFSGTQSGASPAE